MSVCTPVPTGFNALMSVAYGLTDSYKPNSVELIRSKFGAPFDPFKNDQNFVVSGEYSLCVFGRRGRVHSL